MNSVPNFETLFSALRYIGMMRKETNMGEWTVSTFGRIGYLVANDSGTESMIVNAMANTRLAFLETKRNQTAQDEREIATLWATRADALSLARRVAALHNDTLQVRS